RHPEYVDRFAALYRLYLNDGRPHRVGDRFQSPLADVLELIAAQGADGFHRGPVAKAIVTEIQKQGGIITREDLSQMPPVLREPLRGRLEEYDVITMPPPSSGGVALLETFNILAAHERRHPQQSLPNFDHNGPAA